MSAATLNGKPRKQLADQLDRLDGIIDALSEGLNGAVAAAAREGTRLAVKDAIVELLTNPELRALLVPHGAPAPAPKPQGPGLWARLKTRARAAAHAVRDTITAAAVALRTAVATKVAAATGAATALSRLTGEALPARRTVAVAAGVGLTVWVAGRLLPESATAVLAGSGWALAALLVQTGAWLRRAARRLGLLT